MASIASRLDFHPPRPQGTGQAMLVAMLAHLLLLGALTWGVNWKREATLATVEAELWSSLPEQAAPKLIEVAPPPKVETPETPPLPKPPDIAAEKEKPKPPPKVEVKPEPKPEPKPTPKPEPKIDPAFDARKLAEQREKERLENIQRMAGLAGASGAPNAQGSAQLSSGVSASYGARIEAQVRPNHVFTGDISGNPRVEIEVRVNPSGLIMGRPRIVKSSGNREFDESVVRAFEKTAILPRDENGRVPPLLQLGWSAKRNN